MFVTSNAFPVAETEADILESVILLVDTVAEVKIAAPFKVAVPSMARLVFIVVPPFRVTPPFRVAPLLTVNPWFNVAEALFTDIPLLKLAVDPLTVNPLVNVPNPVLERERRRIILRGEVPSPVNPPSGCHFHPRCEQAIKQCQEENPILHNIGGDHEVACFRV